MKKTMFILLTFFVAVLFQACSKDEVKAPIPIDDGHETLLLSGYEYKALGESTVTYANQTLPVKRQLILPVEQFGDGLFAMFGLDEELTEFVAFSLDDEEGLDGNALAFLEDTFYTGENFSLDELDDNRIRLTGILLNENSGEELAIEVLVDLRNFGSGTSSFTVAGDTATLNGTLGSRTYNQLLELNANYRNVHTIRFQDIPGSEDDEVNIQIGRLIRAAGYTTAASATSTIHSGGVDLFCAGKKRTVEAGAEFGVHSWCCGENGEEAFEIPMGRPEHTVMINYFEDMLGPLLGEEFYLFTINAAPFNELHVMTMEEIIRYEFVTE